MTAEASASNGLNGSSSGSSVASPQGTPPPGVFKRPGDPVSFESPIAKRAKTTEESRPLRTISSVFMTTSGYLSPFCEGKLPEARTPHQAQPDSPPPTPPSPPESAMIPPPPPPVPEAKPERKPKKVGKKNAEEQKENKKKNRNKDQLFKPDKIHEDGKVSKLVGTKEIAKIKGLKSKAAQGAGPSNAHPSVAKLTSPNRKNANSPKLTKAMQNKAKAELANGSMSEYREMDVGKLPSEPDKQKLNIFKKISKTPREDKDAESHKHKELHAREGSPVSTIDSEKHKSDYDHHKRTPHTPDRRSMHDDDFNDLRSPTAVGGDYCEIYPEDMSPPGTPSTPKTPELTVPPLVVDQKRKRKDKTERKKKEPKVKAPKSISPKKVSYANP